MTIEDIIDKAIVPASFRTEDSRITYFKIIPVEDIHDGEGMYALYQYYNTGEPPRKIGKLSERNTQWVKNIENGDWVFVKHKLIEDD